MAASRKPSGNPASSPGPPGAPTAGKSPAFRSKVFRWSISRTGRSHASCSGKDFSSKSLGRQTVGGWSVWRILLAPAGVSRAWTWPRARRPPPTAWIAVRRTGSPIRRTSFSHGAHVYGGHVSPDGRCVLFTGNVEEDGDPQHAGAPMGLMRLSDAPVIGGESKAL